MKASWRKGLSGAVSAIVIAIVLVAGLASASYINFTTARYNEAQMQEALRQARLGNELIRIHIHSTDGAVDSPPRITFVNAWGYESRIIQLVIIARNMTPIATIDLRGRPIVLPPGARLTLEPSQIGLSYPTFKRMADELRSIHAYTEAGNSFGSTWGFPREDNMAGRTIAVTYNATTTELWYIPSVTWLNRTWTKFYYTTIGEIPPLQNATIKARNHFEKVRVGIALVNYEIGGGGRSVTIDDSIAEGYPSAPVNDAASIGWDFELGQPHFTPYGWYDPIMGVDKWGYSTWWWYPEGGFTTSEGSPVNVEANTYVAIVNRPLRIVVTQQWAESYCVVSYRLRHVTLTPEPEGYQPPGSSTTARTGMVVAFNYKTFYSGAFYTVYSRTRTAFNDQWGYLIINGGVQYGVKLNAPIPRASYSTTTWTVTESTTTYTTTSTRTIPPSLPVTYVADGDGNLRGVVHRLTTVTLPVNPISAIYIKLPPGDYTVDRYYYVDSVQCNIYVPGPEVSYVGGGDGGRGCGTKPQAPPECIPPPPCPVYLESSTSPAASCSGGVCSSYQNNLDYSYGCKHG
jgi:hypothetical protein